MQASNVHTYKRDSRAKELGESKNTESRTQTADVTHHPGHTQEDDHRHDHVGHVRGRVDVRVALLVDVEHAQHAKDVHECGV